MDTLIRVVENNPTISMGIVLYFFTAAVSTMPKPGDSRPLLEKMYQWGYDFLHVVSNKVIERRPASAPVTSAAA